MIDLGNRNLREVPDSAREASRSLSLHANSLERLPEWLWTLTNLEELYLSRNQLVTLGDGIGSLTKLRVLALHANRLRSISPEIAQCVNLTELRLHNNELSTLPAGIGLLKNLRVLTLSGNLFTDLPSLQGMDVLDTLTLHNNPLAKLVSLPSKVRRVTLPT